MERMPWHRQPGETNKAWHAFRVYLNLDPYERSLFRCWRELLVRKRAMTDFSVDKPNREQVDAARAAYVKEGHWAWETKNVSYTYRMKSVLGGLRDMSSRYNWPERVKAYSDYVFSQAVAEERERRRQDEITAVSRRRLMRDQQFVLAKNIGNMLVSLSERSVDALDSETLKAVRDLTLASERLNLVAEGAFKGLRDILDEVAAAGEITPEDQAKMLEFMSKRSEELENNTVDTTSV
jgi:hypothetical protein